MTYQIIECDVKMTKYRHSENEVANDWNNDTLMNERIDCLKAIGMYKIPANKKRYELRAWDDLPKKVKSKLRHLYDESFYED